MSTTALDLCQERGVEIIHSYHSDFERSIWWYRLSPNGERTGDFYSSRTEAAEAACRELGLTFESSRPVFGVLYGDDANELSCPELLRETYQSASRSIETAPFDLPLVVEIVGDLRVCCFGRRWPVLLAGAVDYAAAQPVSVLNPEREIARFSVDCTLLRCGTPREGEPFLRGYLAFAHDIESARACL